MKYSIGQFSQMVKISCKTLRYYDEIDLLKPAEIGYYNNYRYYDHNSVLQAQQVLIYRQCGLPLEKIRQILQKHKTGTDLKNILAGQLGEMESRIKELHTAHSRICEIIVSLEENEMNGIKVKERPATHVLKLRRKGGHDAIGQMLSVLFSVAAEYRLETAGPHSIVWHENKDLLSDENDIEIFIPVKGEISGEIPNLDIRGAEDVCSCIHKGDFSTIGGTYEKLHEYLNLNKLEKCGSFEEKYTSDMRFIKPCEMETEVLVPVKKITKRISE
jgi:DNA-binding transcriptional MerR regulator